jgi:hypothetical protein
MSTHTKGPWSFEVIAAQVSFNGMTPTAYAIETFHNKETPPLAIVPFWSCANHQADARLIAAAPDLLNACKAALLFHKPDYWTTEDNDLWKGLVKVGCGEEATSKSLCDFIRQAVEKAESK